MARRADPQLRKAWRLRIDQQRQSGLTVAQFCRQEGVGAGSFYFWRRKLKSQAAG